MIRRLLVLACILLPMGCTEPTPGPGDRAVLIWISNAGPEPLECRMIFGHWVERDLGTFEKGSGGIKFEVQQQRKDGALFVMRDDGQRRMMIENIFCARKGDWRATVGQIDLAAVRVARPYQVWVSCALPAAGGRVVCNKPELWNNHL